MSNEFKRTELTDARLSRLQDGHKLTHTQQELILFYLKKIEEYMRQADERRERAMMYSDN